ncbi:radial spoke head protein 4 homolog A-like [Thalassophryne amazonica]|uniref:radial spoke head protein 4 homolog A-like n=1 Tax=Thalassophryne amazonica TaxID=390379 RepID=UPI0014724D8F|nr:radial spoke head protein 4 homolog A-like [Thalassophryne amazonica]
MCLLKAEEMEHSDAVSSFKANMLTNSAKSNLNLYDHLTCVLMKVLDECPENAVDVIEDVSLEVKRSLFNDSHQNFQEFPQSTDAELLAEKQRLLYSQGEDDDREEKLDTLPPNVSEMSYYLERAGVGLGKEEMQRITLALHQLVESKMLYTCRLWGKILGTESSYIIAEAEYTEEQGAWKSDDTDDDEQEEKTEENKVEKQQKTDLLPKSTYKPPLVVPNEAFGSGGNKFVYYVCKEPGFPWVKLPPVTPAQICAARQIHKFFTGRLDARVISYPPFPGNETNYLRAQIAWISAGTQVCPQGFYQMIEGEEDEEPHEDYEVNPDFESIPTAEMVQSMSNWVHHVSHILSQGRCTWVNVLKPGEVNDSLDEEDEKQEDEEEVGPPLLTPLSQDANLYNTTPWSSRLSSSLSPQHAFAVLRSNLWPGAFAYADGKKFENIYIGWGVKNVGEGYSPPVPSPPQESYLSEPGVTEAQDPSVEEEQALKEALEEKDAQETEESDEDEYDN